MIAIDQTDERKIYNFNKIHNFINENTLSVLFFEVMKDFRILKT